MFDTLINEAIGKTARSGTPDLDELETMEPGPFLAIVLSGIDLDGLTGEERITVMQARQRMASHYTAQTYEAMASVVDAYEHEFDATYLEAADATAYELRPALRLTRRAADVELSLALDLRDRIPKVLAALSAGLIDQRRARTIVWQTTHLNDEEARQVVDQIIDQASELTTGQLMARIRRLCMDVDPDQAARRYEQAVADRRVIMDPSPFGTADLKGCDLPPDKAAAATRRINAIAKSLRRDGETRTMDQLRADVYLDLLCGNKTGGKGGTIDLRVDLDTLTELNDHPGDLAGYGPVIADIARKVTTDNEHAAWRYTITHQGEAITTGTTHRRPTTAQKRLVETTHPTCIFPGCRMPTIECDIDHTTAWTDGGPTTTDNLAPLCRHDHTGRHRHGWTYKTLPNSDVEWTSPLGTTYTTRSRSP
ncbi:MAG: DUF222 domain-containing protein [Actinomycetota bacterium]